MKIIQYLYQNRVVVIITVITLIVLVVIYVTSSKNKIIDLRDQDITPAATELEIDMIKVYVTGEIINSQIVTVPIGATIDDIITLCGGVTDTASKNINLVYEIKHNVTIVIKGSNSLEGVDIIEDAGDVTIISDEGGLINGKVNINEATYEELLLLPGVGESTANAIISFRSINGKYKNIEDIMLVPGIKEAKYSSLKDLITTY